MEENGKLGAADVAKRLGLTDNQVYRRIKRGDIPHTLGGNNGTKFLIDPADLEAYIAAGQPRAEPTTAPVLLGIGKVVQMTGLSADLVRRLCYEGRLAHVRGAGPNGHLRISRASVEKFLEPVREDQH